jgi:hypothetical protein
MIVYVQTDGTSRIVGWGDRRSSDAETEVDVPENHPFLNDMPHKYELKNGMVVKSPQLEEKYNQGNEIAEAKAFLNETDFYYIRKLETGEEVPAEIQAKRSAIRKRFKELGV